jgi:uncharacterized protein
MNVENTMISLIEENREALEALCKKYHVKCLEIFGSASTGDWNPESSDLDFLVEFEETNEMGPAEQLFGLFADLQRLFNRDVDLVESDAMENPYLIKSVSLSRKVIYGSKVSKAS